MGDLIPKTREVTDYYIICDKCGKEELSEFNRPQELCVACQDKKGKMMHMDAYHL